MMRHALSGLCLGILTAVAQNGDKPGEAQREVVPADRIPPAPVLSPADQIRTFRLPPGFSAELVAAEPLVHSPVAVEFDPRPGVKPTRRDPSPSSPTPTATGAWIPARFSPTNW